jgi:hypothetical protein
MVQAQTPINLYDNLTNLTVDQSPTYGGFINATATADNLTPNNFYGQKPMGYAQTFGSNTITNLRADDTTFPLSDILAANPNPGVDTLSRVVITQVSLVVTNTNLVDVDARFRLRVYNDNGTSVNGQASFPGTRLNRTDYTVNLTLDAASSPTTFSTQLVTIDLAQPVVINFGNAIGTQKRIWVGGVFDTANGTLSTGNTATDETLLSNIGLLYNNPTGAGFADDVPIKGYSADVAAASGDINFDPSADPTGFYFNNPGVYAFDTINEPPPIDNLRTDFAISFNGYGVFGAAPEPGTLLLLGAGLLSAVLVRRRKI